MSWPHEVSFAYDASGNVIGLKGSDGETNTAIIPRRPLLVTLGDSMFTYDYNTTNITSYSYDSATGLVTAVFASDPSIRAGDTIIIQSVTDNISGYEGEVEVLSYTTSPAIQITYTPLTVPAAATATGGTAVLPWQTRCNGPVANARMMSNCAFEFVNRSQGGDTGACIIERLNRDLDDISPTHVLLCYGTNDVYGSALTVADMLDTLAAIHAYVRSRGAKMGFLTAPPQSSSRSGWSASTLAIAMDWRRAAAEYCRANSLAFIDWWSAVCGSATVVNASDANGNPSSGMMSTDGIHAANCAAIAAGKKIAEWIAKDSGLWQPPLAISAAETANLLSGLFTGTGGSTVGVGSTFTGDSVPDGWKIQVSTGTATVDVSVDARTVATDGDNIGNNFTVAISAASSGAEVRIERSTSAHASFAAGDEADIYMPFALSGCTDIKGYNFRCGNTSNNGSAHNRIGYDLAYIAAAGGNIPETVTGTLSHDLKIRDSYGAPTDVTPSVRLFFGTSGSGAATLKLWRAAMRKAG